MRRFSTEPSAFQCPAHGPMVRTLDDRGATVDVRCGQCGRTPVLIDNRREGGDEDAPQDRDGGRRGGDRSLGDGRDGSPGERRIPDSARRHRGNLIGWVGRNGWRPSHLLAALAAVMWTDLAVLEAVEGNWAGAAFLVVAALLNVGMFAREDQRRSKENER